MLPRPARVFDAGDILTGRVSLEGYPFRLVYLVIGFDSFYIDTRIQAHDLGRVDRLLSAAELLEARGWEVVSVDQGGKLICLRRRGG